MTKTKNVVSLFNGMSCARMAFNNTELDVKLSYSEVDKFANKLTQHLFPGDTPLGDVCLVDGHSLGKVDYLVGGSPCQSFSFSGKRNGMTTSDNEEILTLSRYLELKQEGFGFKGQSYLFWEYVRVLREVQVLNPSVKFLLENVVMSKKWEDVISNELGVSPVMINSSLLSAQNRKRLYWTNINGGVIEQPKDKEIFLKHILQDNPKEGLLSEGRSRWLCSDKGVQCLNKAYTSIKTENQKSACITARAEGSWNSTYVLSNASVEDSYHTDNFNTLMESEYKHGGLLPTEDGLYYRKLTVRECMRLQTIPEDIIDKMLDVDEKGKRLISDSQLYKMCGNSWTVDVISHIIGCGL